MIYGYLRAVENCSPERDISKLKQLQILRDHRVTNIIQDEVSKETNGKELFYNQIYNLEQNDIVVVTKLSRIADSLKELSDVCNILSNKGVILKVLELGDITLNNNGILSNKWLNALREFEDDIKYEKLCKGHLISKKNHQSNSAILSGSPKKYSNKQLSEALKLRERYTFQEIANITGISKRTLLRASKNMQL